MKLFVCLTATLLTVTWGASLPTRQRRSLPGTSWSDWTPCTAQCDQGFQGRHNCGPGYQMPDLTFPDLVPNPPNCVHFVATCNLHPCNDKFNWQEFEPCDKPCGVGTRRRLTAPGCPVCPTADYRFYQDITCHAQSCDKVPGCGKADIMYVLDSSGSVGDYNWFIEKQFAIDVIKALDIGNDETRVGMVTYSTEVELTFDFEEHDTIDDLEQAIWGTPWMAGTTNTADAIRKARQVFQNARSDVKKIMVVVTDGNSNILNETTIPQAEEAKKEGITIFVIGIGQTINNEELEGIGSTPADKYVYHVQDFEALSLITQTIVEGTCEPVVDCGPFGAWDQCSKTCGGGIENRGRACTKSVDGVVTERWTDYENRTCAQQLCPVRECGSWSPEDACTASCGTGSQKVTRVCTTRVGQTVTATETETDYQLCNTHLCPVETCNGWEMMTSCSVTCGSGTALYKRTCRTVYGDGKADKVEDETKNGSCNPNPCPRTVCGDWSAEGACTVSCGGGNQKYTRVCTTYVGQTVTATETETDDQQCNTNPCPRTVCGDWSAEGACTVSCGGGNQKYTRVCTTYVGQTVTATETETDDQQCNTNPCPRTVCGDWSAEGACTVSCGGGNQKYTRVCTTYVGQTVTATETETDDQQCNTNPCPRTVCGDWSPEGACTASCGGGSQKYTRVCTTYVGQTVTATETETDYQLCNTFSCPKTTCGGWIEKVKCSVDCGDGEFTSEKTCRTVYGDGADDKVVVETKNEHCNLGPCLPTHECGNCLYSWGATDWLPVDHDPCSYYVCTRKPIDGGGYEYDMELQSCSPGTIWDQSILTCNHDLQGVCKGGKPTGPTGPVYNGCHLRADPDDETVYIDEISQVKMPCARGTVFDQDECVCVTGDNSGPVDLACDGPLLYFPFDGHLNSLGCEPVSAYQRGETEVTFAWDSKSDRSAKFDGKGVLGVPFLRNFFAERNLQGFTVSLWFKWIGDTSEIGGLVNNGDCDEGHSFELHVGDTGSVAGGSLVTDGVGQKATGAYTVRRWDWTHIAEVYDGTALNLYINGKKVSSTPMTGPISNRHCQMLIGQLGRNERDGLFDGYMDELRVYVRALDANEIKDLAK